MSKQDTHFFNVFSMVIGLLVAIAIALFALARIVAGETQDKQVVADADYIKNVEQRVQPFAQEAVAGQDNTALAIKPDAATRKIAASRFFIFESQSNELITNTPLQFRKLRLRRRARLPLIDRDRILPEIALPGRFAAGSDVTLRHAKRIVVGSEGIAVGPIAPKEHAALSKQVPKPVKACLVQPGIERNAPIDALHNLRPLYEGFWATR